MPRYFFHADGEQDLDGWEFDDVAAAKCEAVKLAGRIICDGADEFWDSAEWNLSVTDATGLILFQLHIVGTEAPVIRGSASPGAAASPST